MHPAIQAAQFEVAEAKKKLKAAIEHVRSKCLHERVWEVSYKQQEHAISLRKPSALRMCKSCGLEEEASAGWNWEHLTLRNEVVKEVTVIERDDFYNKRID